MAEELIDAYGDDLESITLVRGSKGRFEVTVNGQEVYSKSRTKRHAKPGEVVENLKKLLDDTRWTPDDAGYAGAEHQ